MNFVDVFLANFGLWDIPEAVVPKNAGSGGFLPYGFAGVIKGAGTCFYGFIGFECIATTGDNLFLFFQDFQFKHHVIRLLFYFIGGEVINPEKTLPLAIIISLFVIFLAYFSIATVLTLLVPYFEQVQSLYTYSYILQKSIYSYLGIRPFNDFITFQDVATPLAYAFSFIGYDWAKWVINIGSLFGLIAA